MKLKELNKIPAFLGAIFTAVVIPSCGGEDVPVPQTGKVDNITIELSIVLPSSTRSHTAGDGYSNETPENGLPLESTLSKVNLYFAEVKEDEDASKDEIIYTLPNIRGAEISLDEKTPDEGVAYLVKKEINPVEFSSVLCNKKLRLYIVGNTDLIGINSVNTATLSFLGLDTGYLGVCGDTGKLLPLVNKEASDILDLTGMDIDAVKTLLASAVNNTLNLSGKDNVIGGFGAISLERGVARIDYKDKQRYSEATKGSGLDSNGFPVAGHVYPLGASGLYLKVDAMQPVNVAAQEYVFRHTSAGTETEVGNQVDLFGIENGGETGKYTWIADSDRGSKTFLNAPTKNGDSYSLASDKWTTLGSAFNAEDYRAWRYLSENTPASVSDMKQGLSTGVAFRVVICDAKGEPLTNLDTSSFTGVTFDTSVSSAPTIKYKSVTSQLENLGDGKGYALTYYHWIRHNNKSGSVEITDPMEFAVVRNNIYKLSVIKFDGLPRPYNPDGKDEEETDNTLDILLEVKVKAWDYYRLEMDV